MPQITCLAEKIAIPLASPNGQIDERTMKCVIPKTHGSIRQSQFTDRLQKNTFFAPKNTMPPACPQLSDRRAEI